MHEDCIVTVGIDQFVVNLGGHIVRGWSEDADALMMPEAFELMMTRRGGDGQLIGSPTNDQGGPISLKLLANSSSTAFFMRAGTSQKKNPKSVICWHGGIENISQNYKFVVTHGVMTHMPLGQNAGKSTAANQVFSFDLQVIDPDYEMAAFQNPADGPLINRIVNRPTQGITLRPSMIAAEESVEADDANIN